MYIHTYISNIYIILLYVYIFTYIYIYIYFQEDKYFKYLMHFTYEATSEALDAKVLSILSVWFKR